MATRKNDAVLRQFRTLFTAGVVGDLTDGQLLERFAARRGEPAEAAFAELVGRHGRRVRPAPEVAVPAAWASIAMTPRCWSPSAISASTPSPSPTKLSAWPPSSPGSAFLRTISSI